MKASLINNGELAVRLSWTRESHQRKHVREVTGVTLGSWPGSRDTALEFRMFWQWELQDPLVDGAGCGAHKGKELEKPQVLLEPFTKAAQGGVSQAQTHHFAHVSCPYAISPVASVALVHALSLILQSYTQNDCIVLQFKISQK